MRNFQLVQTYDHFLVVRSFKITSSTPRKSKGATSTAAATPTMEWQLSWRSADVTVADVDVVNKRKTKGKTKGKGEGKEKTGDKETTYAFIIDGVHDSKGRHQRLVFGARTAEQREEWIRAVDSTMTAMMHHELAASAVCATKLLRIEKSTEEVQYRMYD